MKKLYFLILLFGFVGCGKSGKSEVEAKCEFLKSYDSFMSRNLLVRLDQKENFELLFSEMEVLYREKAAESGVSIAGMDEIVNRVHRKVGDTLKGDRAEEICRTGERQCARRFWSFVYREMKREYNCG